MGNPTNFGWRLNTGRGQLLAIFFQDKLDTFMQESCYEKIQCCKVVTEESSAVRP